MKIVQLLPGLVSNTTFVIYLQDNARKNVAAPSGEDTINYVVRMVLGDNPDKNVMVEATTVYYRLLGKMYITQVDIEGILKVTNSNVDFQANIIKHFFYGIHHSLIPEVNEVFFQFPDAYVSTGQTVGSLLKDLDPQGFPNLSVMVYERYVFGRYDKNRQFIELSAYLDIDSQLPSTLAPVKIMAIRNPDLGAVFSQGNWANLDPEMQKLWSLYSTNTFCQIYNACDGYLVLAYEQRNDGKRVYLGHLIALLFDACMEIYDVYVNETHRSMGIGKHLMHFVTENTAKDFVWLGVMLSNPLFFTATQLYLKAGFYYPMVTNVTPGGQKVDDLFLSLIYIKGSHSVKSQKEKLKNVEEATCYKTFKLKPVLIKNFYKFLAESYEVGGSIAAEDPDPQDYGANVRQQVANNVVSMGLGDTIEKISQLRAGDPVAHVVRLDGVDLEYSFHTHPAVCYRDYKTYLGWPSSLDINLVLSSFETMKVHFVVSCEGIYIMSRSTEFHHYLMLCAQQGKYDLINSISSMVMDHFSVFDFKRFSNIDDTIVRLTLKHALTFEERQELSLYKTVKSLLQQKRAIHHFLKARVDYFLAYINNVTLTDMIGAFMNESKTSGRQKFVTEQEVTYVAQNVPAYKKNIAIVDVQFFPWEDLNLRSIHPCEDASIPLTRSVFNSNTQSNVQFSQAYSSNGNNSNSKSNNSNSDKSNNTHYHNSSSRQSSPQLQQDRNIQKGRRKNNANVNSSRVNANQDVKPLFFNVNDCINIYKVRT
jgi:GNAT superfamily N-acetyltransferase